MNADRATEPKGSDDEYGVPLLRISVKNMISKIDELELGLKASVGGIVGNAIARGETEIPVEAQSTRLFTQHISDAKIRLSDALDALEHLVEPCSQAKQSPRRVVGKTNVTLKPTAFRPEVAYYYHEKNGMAFVGHLREDGRFLVRAGSSYNPSGSFFLPERSVSERRELEASGDVVQVPDGTMVFLRDILFRRPCVAMEVCSGDPWKHDRDWQEVRHPASDDLSA